MDKTNNKKSVPESLKGPNRQLVQRGRPETRIIKLDATPEQVARAIFSAVKPPDPIRRIKKK